jgi:hypothetical protein
MTELVKQTFYIFVNSVKPHITDAIKYAHFIFTISNFNSIAFTFTKTSYKMQNFDFFYR